MRFEARDLKSYAEYVPSNELQEGTVYFIVEFIDSEARLPRLEPVVFIGRNLDAGEVGQLYFQDAASHRAGVRYGARSQVPEGEVDEAVFIQTPEEQGRRVFDYERALDVLMSCALRRSGVRGTM